MKGEYYIFKCPKCRLPQYVKVGQKTRKCPGCNKIINLRKVWIRGWAQDINEAVYIIQQIKMLKKDEDTFESAYDKKKKNTWYHFD